MIGTTTTGGIRGVRYRYGTYGVSLAPDGVEGAVNASELGYTGGLRLSEGLIHLNARAYSPGLRRFVQPDNVDFARYSYVSGDPISLVDPTGHAAVCPTSFWKGFYGADSAAGIAIQSADDALQTVGQVIDSALASLEKSAANVQDVSAGVAPKATLVAGGAAVASLVPVLTPVAAPVASFSALIAGGAASISRGAELLKDGARVLQGKDVDPVDVASAVIGVSRAVLEMDGETLYRSGGSNPGNLKLRVGEEKGISFRDSLSNPIGAKDQPVFKPGDSYIAVSSSKLPDGSVIRDGRPAGHVNVQASPETIKAAIVGKGRLPEDFP